MNASVTVSTGQTPPVSNAGPNQTVSLGSTVVLNGGGSTSVGGRALTCSWTLITLPAGSAATLADVVALVAAGELADRRGPTLPYTLSLCTFVVGLLVAASAPTMDTAKIAQIADGLYLGQLVYATDWLKPFSPATPIEEYKYRLFGYFLLMDEEWHQRRLRIGFDLQDT
jgi:MFS family permease